MREVVALIGRSAEGKVVVLDRSRPLFGDVLIERAPGREIDELHPATHAEHWLAVGDGPAREGELHSVAVTIGLVAERVRRLSIGDGIDVRAARKEDRVKP